MEYCSCKFNLALLSKYSFYATLSKDERHFSISLPKEFGNSITFYSNFKQAIQQYYPKAFPHHCANLLYLFHELYHEVDRNYIPQESFIEAKNILKFLKSLIALKSLGTKKFEISINPTEGVGDTAKFKSETLFEQVIEHQFSFIKRHRFQNEALFYALEPGEWTEDVVQKSIDSLNQPFEKMHKPTHQIAYYAWMIVGYLNNEVDKSGKTNSTAQQYLLLYHILNLFKISHFIITAEELASYDSKTRIAEIKAAWKKLLENYSNSKNSDYELRLR